MNCTKCGATLESDAVFCPECGSPVTKQEQPKQEATMFCPMCGATVEAGSEWCPSCGVAIAAAQKHEARNFSFEPFKKYLIPAAAVVGGLIVLVVLISVFKGSNLPVFYVKDGNLCASNWKEDKDVRIEKDFSDEGYSPLTQVSDDEKYLYYAMGYGDNYDLYRKKIKDLDGDDERIAKELVGHILLDNNDVLYLDREGDLNLTDGDESERVAKDVMSYRINDKQTEVVWIDHDGDLYRRDLKLKKDEEKLAKEVDNFVAATDNFEQIAYVAEGAVYVLCDYENEEKVFDLEDVTSGYQTAIKDGSDQIAFYFGEVADKEKKNAYDFVKDDMLSEDEGMEEPQLSDYEVTVSNGFWGDSTEVDRDAYNEAYEKYREKVSRDNIREELKNAEVERNLYNIYYYTVKDGAQKLSEAYRYTFETMAYDKEVVMLKEITDVDSVSAKISEFSSGEKNVWDFISALNNSSEGDGKVSIYEGKKGAVLDIDVNDSSYCVGENDAKKLVYVAVSTGGSDFDLLSVKYGSKLGKTETVEQDVEQAICRNDQIFYIVDEDLYCEGKCIDKDVESVYGSGIDDGKWVALLECDDDDNEGDMKLWNGRKLIEVERDVRDYFVVDKDKIAILHDYGNSSGTLSYYNGRKVKKIDDDVEQIISCY